jgi:adenosine deaminase
MADKQIAVEISPSSSDYILGVKGAAHPLRDYVKAGVPVVISTDDAGVARSDLTNEYMRAVMESGLGYEELKRVSRDSARYAFIRGKHIWSGADYSNQICGREAHWRIRPAAKLTKECTDLFSSSERPRIEANLEDGIAQFESQF